MKDKERARARSRKWYAKNREKGRAACRRYYHENREKRKADWQQYYAENQERLLERARKRRREKKDRIRESWQDYYKKNRERLKKRAAEYRKENADRVREHFTNYFRERRKTDPQFRLRTNLRNTINCAIKKYGTGKKSAKTELLIGCTISQLYEHLESLFLPGMSWENYGRNGWHVDHIRPCASFDLTDPEQQRACFHWSNLQPLWEADNIRKGASLGLTA